MRRSKALFCVIALGIAVLGGAALAQTVQPFDMTGDGASAPRSGPAVPSAPVSPGVPPVPSSAPYPAPLQLSPGSGAAAAPSPVTPMASPALAGGITPVSPFPNAVQPTVAPSAPPVAATASSAPSFARAASTVDGLKTRYVIPQSALRLEGENDQRSWTIFLAGDQIGRASRLSVSYKNALVVMPEASRLRISMNGQTVLETPLASSDRFKSVTASIPAGLLQGGANLVRIQAFQRHRTDCSIQSTYELWTDIDPAQTTLTFEGNEPIRLRTLEDLPAVGFDKNGTTRVRIIAPNAREAAVAPYILKLTQALALYGNYPNLAVSVVEGKVSSDEAGSLIVMMGAVGDLQGLLSAPLTTAASQPFVGFVSEPTLGSSTLVVSGATWGQVSAAINAIAARVDRPPNVTRTTLNTATWFAPDVHFFAGQESVTLAKLGVSTQQFSGRRFRVMFGVGIPSDFYAEAYGEATLLLDAAYTPAVLPASHIDIYVNGQIAATTRVVNRSGGIFRHLPIQIPFRHFRPGVNRIVIEAALDTAADQACGPGGSIAGPDRFVLFDTTEFSMPAFARIARRPNLAAFTGTGFPYNRTDIPSAIVLGRSDNNVVAAAATLLGRLATQAGRILPFTSTPIGSVGDQTALFVGAIPQIPAAILGQFEISEQVRTTWKTDVARPANAPGTAGSGPTENVAPSADAESQNTEVLFNKWRDELADGGGWRGQISGFEDWMKRTFDISFAALRVGPDAETAFEPKPKTTLLFAQGASPGGSGTWTLMTAPSDEQLASGAVSVVGIDNWSKISGAFSTFSATTNLIENQAAANYTFVVTQPLTLQNVRLILANWLSNNLLIYAIALLSLCFFLGIVTSGLLFRLGRPS